MGILIDITKYSIGCAPLYSFVGYGAAAQTSLQYNATLDIAFLNLDLAVLINKDGYLVSPTVEVRYFSSEKLKECSEVFL